MKKLQIMWHQYWAKYHRNNVWIAIRNEDEKAVHRHDFRESMHKAAALGLRHNWDWKQ